MLFRLFTFALISFSFVCSSAFCAEEMTVDIGRGEVDVIYPTEIKDGKPLPMIVALHGFTGNKKQLEVKWKLRRHVDEKQFVLVYPEGTRDSRGRRFWNATNACCNMEGIDVNDVEYLMELVSEIESKFLIDSDSIHFAGWSNGGFMSYRLACQVSDRIASFASLAGANYKRSGICNSAVPVHVLQIHGTQDPIVEYEGGFFRDEQDREGMNWYPGALESVSSWAKINGCRNLPVQLGPLDLDRSIEGSDTTILRFENERTGATAELWTIHGGSHGPDFSLNYGELIVDWLLSHRKIKTAAVSQSNSKE